MCLISHPNRPLKRKEKKGCGCKMCKPHKGTWGKILKPKERAEALGIVRVIQQGKVVDNTERY